MDNKPAVTRTEIQKWGSNTTVQQWSRTSESFSLLSNRGLTPEQAVDSPQVSLLRKENNELLGACMAGLLMELSQLTSCAWSDKDVAMVAKTICDSFWGLRMDEFIYVFRRIVDGGFGKIYGTIDRGDLGEFLTKYTETDRLPAEQMMRDELRAQSLAEEKRAEANALTSEETTEKISALADQLSRLDRVKRKEHDRPAVGDKHFDSTNYQLLYTHQNDMSDEQVKAAADNAEAHGWSETKRLAEEIICAREDRRKQ